MNRVYAGKLFTAELRTHLSEWREFSETLPCLRAIEVIRVCVRSLGNFPYAADKLEHILLSAFERRQKVIYGRMDHSEKKWDDRLASQLVMSLIRGSLDYVII